MVRCPSLPQCLLLVLCLLVVSLLSGCLALCSKLKVEAAQGALEDGYARRSLELSRSACPLLCSEAAHWEKEAEAELRIGEEELTRYRSLPSTEQQQQAARELREGMRLLEKEPAKAVEHLRRSNELWPRPYTLGLQARAHAQRGNFREQRRVLDRAMTIAAHLRGGRPVARLRDAVALPRDVAISRNGRLLATYDYRKIVLWDLTRLVEVKSLWVDGLWWQLDISPEADRVALADGRGGLQVYELGSGRMVSLHAPDQEHPDYLSTLAFGSEGELAAAFGPRILRWSPQGERLVAQAAVTADATVVGLALGPGAQLLAALEGGALTLWSPEQAQWQSLPGLEGPPVSMAFSTDGTRALVVDDTGRLLLVDVRTRASVPVPVPNVLSAAFSADGQQVLALNSEQMLFSVSADGTATEVRRIAPPTIFADALVAELAPAHDLAAMIMTNGESHLVSLSHGGTILPLRLPTSAINSLAFSPDGETLAVASFDLGIKLWGSLGGTRALVPGSLRHTGVTWAPRGKVLVMATQTGFQFWDVLGGVMLRELPPAERVALSPDGTRAVTVTEQGAVWLHTLGPKLKQRPLEGGSGTPHAVAFSGDSRRVIAQLGQRVLAWDLDRPGPPVVLSEVARTMSVAGSTLVIATHEENLLRVDLERGGTRLLRRWHPVAGMALSPDGAWLATGLSSEVSVLDASSGAERWSQRSHLSSARALAFSPDGRTLASGGHEGVVLLWDVSGKEAPSGPLATLVAADFVRGLHPPPRAAQRARCDWVLLAADGRVDGSANGGELVLWDFEGLLMPGAAGWEERLTSGLFHRLLERH
ncbi:WD40 repeat domain-containing protein [Archangium gephyra]|nr:WD40 repeat domain-containing protein [Archangium gephyra]